MLALIVFHWFAFLIASSNWADRKIINILFPAGSRTVYAEVEEQPESDPSDDEEPMGTDGAVVDKLSEEAPPGRADGDAASKASVVPSGLPQGKEDLEALIKTIHDSVSNSVLPRLHKCLTAKVQSTHTHTHTFLLILA